MSLDVREKPPHGGDRLDDEDRPRDARTIPVYRDMIRLVRHPVSGLEEIGRRCDGEVVRLDLGLFRPYLVTSPEHVKHVLRDNAANYLREGMLWNPVRRLIGDGVSGEGPTWEPRRKMMQPLFSAKHIGSLVGQMAAAVAEAVDTLDPYVRAGWPINVGTEMTRIVEHALIRALFGGRISTSDADRLGRAIATAFTSLGARMLLPFVPASVPLPGDQAFLSAVRTVDEVMFPLVRERRREATDDYDLVTLLCQARDDDGNALTDRQIRDDVVSIFVAGTETTAMALTWLWVALDAHPLVATRLRDEVERVVGSRTPGPSHLRRLQYTRMVLQELLRMYPVAWFFPRTAKEKDSIGGVRIPAGSTVILSPYLTQRMESIWERPHVFDPERFAPGAEKGRHRFSYFPFAAGPHQCLGSHFFTVEAQLIVATVLSRYRTRLAGPPPNVHMAVTLRPRQRVDMVLSPIEHS
jgi:cytochrome P450